MPPKKQKKSSETQPQPNLNNIRKRREDQRSNANQPNQIQTRLAVILSQISLNVQKSAQERTEEQKTKLVNQILKVKGQKVKIMNQEMRIIKKLLKMQEIDEQKLQQIQQKRYFNGFEIQEPEYVKYFKRKDMDWEQENLQGDKNLTDIILLRHCTDIMHQQTGNILTKMQNCPNFHNQEKQTAIMNEFQ